MTEPESEHLEILEEKELLQDKSDRSKFYWKHIRVQVIKIAQDRVLFYYYYGRS